MNYSFKKLTRLKKVAIGTVIMLGVITLFSELNGSSPRTALIRTSQRARLVFAKLPTADIFLPVKFDKQDHALSCEVATLKMALAYKGIQVSEAELIRKLGVDPTVKRSENGQLVWGNPQKAFVGNIDGRMPATGYGVYWEPIERVGSDYRPTRSLQGASVATIAQELQLGNPVIIWGYLGSGKPFSWKTPDNETIHAVYYEHTFIVNGLKGSVEKPEGFFVIDPVYGQRYWSLATFTKQWRSFGNSGVVVY